jgi:hypothetical protein
VFCGGQLTILPLFPGVQQKALSFRQEGTWITPNLPQSIDSDSKNHPRRRLPHSPSIFYGCKKMPMTRRPGRRPSRPALPNGKGILARDRIEKFKRIEKLSSYMRSEIEPVRPRSRRNEATRSCAGRLDDSAVSLETELQLELNDARRAKRVHP